MEKTHPWRGKKMTPQPFAMRKLVSFQSDYSRAVIPSKVLCCFLGSRVLTRKGAVIRMVKQRLVNQRCIPI
jgi:hypothetical protein